MVERALGEALGAVDAEESLVDAGGAGRTVAGAAVGGAGQAFGGVGKEAEWADDLKSTKLPVLTESVVG